MGQTRGDTGQSTQVLCEQQPQRNGPGWQTGRILDVSAHLAYQEARRIVVVDKPELGQARIIVAHEGIARTEPERIPLDLMNDALGGSGFSSRLMIKVRAEEGLTYGIGSGFSLRSVPGPFGYLMVSPAACTDRNLSGNDRMLSIFAPRKL